MDKIEKLALSALQSCTYLPGSSEKRFVMRSLGPETKMTEKQTVWFWKIVIRYRRQHKSEKLVEYAKKQLGIKDE